MQRVISSRMTFLYKVLLPVVWIGGFWCGTLAIFIAGENSRDAHPATSKWMFLGAAALGTIVLLRFCAVLKRVAVEGQTLLVSNYRREIVVPLADVKAVTENRWINIHPVTLHFSRDTDFGNTVTFMPHIRWFGLFSSHPIVHDLRELVRSASR